MKTRTILSIALPILAAACGFIHPNRVTPTPSPSSAPAPLPTPIYRVDIQADASTLPVGGRVTVTGTFIGSFGNPMYYLDVSDQTPVDSNWHMSLLPGNVVHETTGASNILELVSTSVTADRLTAVFRARAKGTAAVRIGINGEIVETDGPLTPFFNYVSKFSKSLRIGVI